MPDTNLPRETVEQLNRLLSDLIERGRAVLVANEPFRARFVPQAYPLKTVSSQLLGANDGRRLLILQNLSNQTVYIQFSQEARNEQALQFPPGAFLGFDTIVPINEIFARSAAATTGYFVVIEA